MTEIPKLWKDRDALDAAMSGQPTWARLLCIEIIDEAEARHKVQMLELQIKLLEEAQS